MDQIAYLYKCSKGFTDMFAGTSITVTILSSALIDLANDLLVFDPSLDGSRRYSKCFHAKRTDIVTLRTIFRGLARETTGDVYATSALAMAHDERVNAVLETSLALEKRSDPPLVFSDSKHSGMVFRVFNCVCPRSDVCS